MPTLSIPFGRLAIPLSVLSFRIFLFAFVSSTSRHLSILHQRTAESFIFTIVCLLSTIFYLFACFRDPGYLKISLSALVQTALDGDSGVERHDFLSASSHFLSPLESDETSSDSSEGDYSDDGRTSSESATSAPNHISIYTERATGATSMLELGRTHYKVASNAMTRVASLDISKALNSIKLPETPVELSSSTVCPSQSVSSQPFVVVVHQTAADPPPYSPTSVSAVTTSVSRRESSISDREVVLPDPSDNVRFQSDAVHSSAPPHFLSQRPTIKKPVDMPTDERHSLRLATAERPLGFQSSSQSKSKVESKEGVENRLPYQDAPLQYRTPSATAAPEGVELPFTTAIDIPNDTIADTEDRPYETGVEKLGQSRRFTASESPPQRASLSRWVHRFLPQTTALRGSHKYKRLIRNHRNQSAIASRTDVALRRPSSHNYKREGFVLFNSSAYLRRQKRSGATPYQVIEGKEAFNQHEDLDWNHRLMYKQRLENNQKEVSDLPPSMELENLAGTPPLVYNIFRFKEDRVYQSDVKLRFCRRCQLLQPLRAKHCSSCGRCVCTHDHHCPWIGTCVGENNRCIFLWYLSFECMELLWGGVASLQLFFSPEMLHRNTLKPALFIVTVILWTLLLMVFSLWLFHCLLAMINLTTWEYLAWPKISYLKNYPRSGPSPFSMGLVKNLCAFCCIPSFPLWMQKKCSYRTIVLGPNGELFWRSHYTADP